MSFWDTSALVPLFLDEGGSDLARSLFEQDPDVLTWWGSRVESMSAITRAVRNGRLDGPPETHARDRHAELFRSVNEVAPSEELRDRAERLLGVHPLRAADALQLGAALVWARERPTKLTFVCLDERLREAARREGFTVLPTR